MQDIPAFPISAPPVILRLDGEPEKEISSAFLYAEIKPFILFDGHFPFFYSCIHSISPEIEIFRVIGQNVLVKIYIMLVLRAEYGAY